MVEGAHDRLYLSPEETIFLSIFHEEQKSFDTRVVHCGVGSFPVMSLVLAFDANIYLFVGMNRVLTNIRKGLVGLIILSVIVPNGLNTANHRHPDTVFISMSTSTTTLNER
ncbi:hypothetical protein RB195_000193 [Necator americanus]|uniref:Uncharacterized protein n=1 Tax=Necator americanus TaxID=51031 RepID=A0ABR1D8E5_NECAM